VPVPRNRSERGVVVRDRWHGKPPGHPDRRRKRYLARAYDPFAARYTSRSFTVRDEAWSWARATRRGLVSGTMSAARCPLRVAADAYLAWLRRTPSPTTGRPRTEAHLANVESILARAADVLHGDMNDPALLTRAEHYLDRLRVVRNGRISDVPASPKTRREHGQVLRSLCGTEETSLTFLRFRRASAEMQNNQATGKIAPRTGEGFSTFLRDYLQIHNLTQGALAKHLASSESRISAWRRGRNPPPVTARPLVAERLGLTLARLDRMIADQTWGSSA